MQVKGRMVMENYDVGKPVTYLARQTFILMLIISYISHVSTGSYIVYSWRWDVTLLLILM